MRVLTKQELDKAKTLTMAELYALPEDIQRQIRAKALRDQTEAWRQLSIQDRETAEKKLGI